MIEGISVRKGKEFPLKSIQLSLFLSIFVAVVPFSGCRQTPSAISTGHDSISSPPPNKLAAARKELVILCVGDSITAGTYPKKLQTNLDKAGIPAKVLNCGMDGYTSGAYLRFMKYFDLFKMVRPGVILLQLGTNDARTDFAHTETVQFRENMENMVKLIRKELYRDKPPLVLISTVLPIIPRGTVFTKTSAERITEEINPAIRDISNKLNLPLLDNYELFKNRLEWLTDGVHPNEEGYQAIADNWFSLIAQVTGKKSPAPGKTGLIYHESYLLHDTGKDHPESPQRLKGIIEHLKETGVLSQLLRIEPSPAPIKWITSIHTQQYVEHVRESCEDGGHYLDSVDTGISLESYEVARLGVGGVLKAVDAVITGRVKNAFCAIRPPGHHALADRAMGFCIFNNVAIATRYIQEQHGLPKVLIVDWDVHHGNGTQAAFYDDPNVLYFSIHRYPFYPGSGAEKEKGEGKGLGGNINVPLRAGCGDREYVKALEDKLKPPAIAFDPDFIIISAGFDAHKDDPLGGMQVTAKGFAEMTRIVKEIADLCCEGRVISVLEGGYDLIGLSESVRAHISALRE